MPSARAVATVSTRLFLTLLVAACGAFAGTGNTAAEDSADAGAAEGGAEGSASSDSANADASACTADLTSDVTNCGWCGHDCAGASCSSGECAPTKIVDGMADEILGIAINGTNIFWYTVAGAVSTCPKSGCPGNASTNLFSLSSVTAIAADDADVYAIGDSTTNSLLSCTVGGCGKAPSTLAMNVGYSTQSALAIDATGIFWVENSAGVFKCAKAGACTPTLLSGPSSGGAFLSEYANQLYWVEMTNKLVTCDPTSCAPHTLGAGVMTSAAVGPSGIYWTDGADNGSVTRLPLAGGQPALFANGEYRPSGVVIDTVAAYWFTRAAATSVVKRAPVAGGGATVVASDQDSPVQILVDDQYVYWALPTSVWRVPK